MGGPWIDQWHPRPRKGIKFVGWRGVAGELGGGEGGQLVINSQVWSAAMPDLLLFFNITCQMARNVNSHIFEVMLTAPCVPLHVYGFRCTASCVLFHFACFLPTAVCPLLNFDCFIVDSILPASDQPLVASCLVCSSPAERTVQLALTCQHSCLPADTYPCHVSTHVCQLAFTSTKSALTSASWH